MAKKYKILVTSILAGSGHNSFGDFLFNELKKNKDWELVRFIHPSKMMDSTYNSTTKHLITIFNFLIEHAPRLAADIFTLSQLNLVDKCIQVINQEKPDCVLSTHHTITALFKISQWFTKNKFLILNTYLDYGAQPSALLPYDLYLRPDYSVVLSKVTMESIKKSTKQKPEYILMAGRKPQGEFLETDLDTTFSKEKYREKLLKNFSNPLTKQISSKKTSILIASGGGGSIQRTQGILNKISQYQKTKIELLDKFQFFVICGQNHKFQKKIMKIRKTKLAWQNIFPFGWLSPKEYALVQKASDYPILYSMAPATMFELMASDTLPLIIHKVRAMHEKGNVEFVEQSKIGQYVGDDAELIDGIFKNKFTRDKVKYEERAIRILRDNKERFDNFVINLQEVFNRPIPKSNKVYNVDFKNQISSVAISIIFFVAYIVLRIIAKILGTVTFWRKYFRRHQRDNTNGKKI